LIGTDADGLAQKVFIYAITGASAFKGHLPPAVVHVLTGIVKGIDPEDDRLSKAGAVGKAAVEGVEAGGVKNPPYKEFLWWGVNANDWGAPYDVEQIVKDMNSVKGNPKGCKFILIGYSWGATTATKVASDVVKQTNHKFDLIFTIDPITFRRVAKNGEKPPIKPVSDFTENSKYDAGDYATNGNWVNWYQNLDIDSGPPPPKGTARGAQVRNAHNTPATENMFNALGPNSWKTAHQEITRLPDVLNSLRGLSKSIAEQD